MDKNVREYLARIGRSGGKIGGKSRSANKLAAVRRNVKKAQAARRRKAGSK
jgi:hypothetical protein